MPKVTQEFRDHQAARILSAAERCFAASGFHATSMDQVIAEAGMSSSTVYRYFPAGKQALVRAVSLARMGPLLTKLRELAHAECPLPLEAAFTNVLRGISGPRSVDDSANDDAAVLDLSARLAVNAWGERTRDPELGALMRENYGAIRAELTFLVRRWVNETMIVTPLSPEDTADLIQHAAFGVLAEQAIVGHSDLVAASRSLGVLFNASDA